jgi:hypothetical protein
MAILDLISQVHLPSSVNKLPKYLKHFTFSSCFCIPYASYDLSKRTTKSKAEFERHFVFLVAPQGKTTTHFAVLRLYVLPVKRFNLYLPCVLQKQPFPGWLSMCLI